MLLISPLFGIIAIFIPLLSFFREDINSRKLSMLIVASLSCLAMSLLIVLLYLNHLTTITDFSALLDLSDFLTNYSLLLTIVTIILNIVSVIRKK